MGRVKKFLGVFAVAIFAIAVFTSPASAVAVDLELILLADVSGSVSAGEFALQRDGYVAAFEDASIHALITSTAGGSLGRIAATLVYWSSSTQQSQSVGWTLIDSVASSNAFAAAIGGAARPFSGATAIGSALSFASTLHGANGFEGEVIIDVTGDGSTNQGLSSASGRTIALASGVTTINGLVIGGSGSVFTHYSTSVIGGIDPFVDSAATFGDFEDSIKDKLEEELGGGERIPEPASMMLLGSGLLGMIGFRKKKRS